MEVRFERTGERRYGVFVVRPGFGPVEMDPAPSYGPDLPHDFVHFAVERALGLERGVFGQLAAGGDAGTFRITPTTTESREVSRTRRRQRRRGERLEREGRDEAELSERAATICHHAWLARSSVPARRARAEAMEPFARKARAACTPAESAALSDAVIEEVASLLDELSARWSEIGVGQWITLQWPAPHEAPR